MRHNRVVLLDIEAKQPAHRSRTIDLVQKQPLMLELTPELPYGR